MGFVVQWLWYLLAFLVGSAVARVITSLAIPRHSREEAIAALPGAREVGAL